MLDKRLRVREQRITQAEKEAGGTLHTLQVDWAG